MDRFRIKKRSGPFLFLKGVKNAEKRGHSAKKARI